MLARCRTPAWSAPLATHDLILVLSDQRQAHIRLGLPAWLIFLSVWAVSPLHEVLDALPVALVEDLERLIIRFIGLCMLLLLLIVV